MTSLSTIRSTISFLASLIMTSYINVKKFHRTNKTIDKLAKTRLMDRIILTNFSNDINTYY